jgi:DNA polymerase I-like protein with 3'-5' exonuclease and polymerase domains
VLVERELATQHVEIKAQELADLNSKFRSRFMAEIEEIERELTEQCLAIYKSEKGRQDAILRLKENPIVFNTKSTKHLQRLFIDKLKLQPKFLTPSGAPSFGAKFLFQYGEAGKLLKGKGTLLISKRQGEALIDLSEYDGRWHVSVRTSSTRSGRLSGGN